MKRKLDQNDRPAGFEDTETPIAAKTEGSKADPSFADFGLDARLVQAIPKLS